MKIYISGAITGVDNYLEIFSRVEKHLTAQNIEVVNPCALTHDHDKSYGSYMKEDIKALLDCDAIFMIWGWGSSKGAKFEKEVADVCGIEVLYGGQI